MVVRHSNWLRLNRNNKDLKENKNFDGLLVGVMFALVSFLLTLTFVIPIISVFPGVIIESLAKGLIDNNPYSNVGKMTILLLIIIFIVVLSISLFKIRKTVIRGERISKAKIAMSMAGLYFIVHALGFYIYWGFVLNFRGDGQLIFAATDSFPISSWAFIPIGLTIDIVKNARIKVKHSGGV